MSRASEHLRERAKALRADVPEAAELMKTALAEHRHLLLQHGLVQEASWLRLIEAIDNFTSVNLRLGQLLRDRIVELEGESHE